MMGLNKEQETHQRRNQIWNRNWRGAAYINAAIHIHIHITHFVAAKWT